MTPDDRGSVTFVDMVLVLLEDQFPWLTTDSRDAVSGADTVDQLIKLHASLMRQPIARGRYYVPRGRPHHDQLATSPGLLIFLSEKVAKGAARNEEGLWLKSSIKNRPTRRGKHKPIYGERPQAKRSFPPPCTSLCCNVPSKDLPSSEVRTTLPPLYAFSTISVLPFGR